MKAAPWIALGVSILGLTWTVLWSTGQARAGDRGKLANRIQAVDDRVTTLATEMTDRGARLETKVEILFRSVTVSAAQVLHSPHPEHARRDELLEQLMAGDMGLAEAAELAGLVDELLSDRVRPPTPAQRLAAGQVLGYLAARFGVGSAR